ncbi:MAG: hypothetical protein IJD13_02060 [Oscillospiraceae bacterium]|nr:hypothetical protein [Oscillospiraceae bacterium]
MKNLLKKLTAVCLGLIIAVSAMAAPVSAAWSKTSSGQWIYTSASGTRTTGWLRTGGAWYYFDKNGIMQTGWQKVDGAWYYLNASGDMRTGWFLTGGKWYYFNPSGNMRTGWFSYNNQWYYFDADGKMATGWRTIGGKQYYMTESGAMTTEPVVLDGISYSFDASGACTGSTVVANTIDYQVLRLVNELRKDEGLPSLQLSAKLCNAAAKRAREQAQMEKLVHKRPDGRQWYTVLPEYGISNLGGSAENLASGMDSAEAVVKAWMESPSHKEAILGDYLYMGVASSSKSNTTYWAQLFSRSESV